MTELPDQKGSPGSAIKTAPATLPEAASPADRTANLDKGKDQATHPGNGQPINSAEHGAHGTGGNVAGSDAALPPASKPASNEGTGAAGVSPKKSSAGGAGEPNRRSNPAGRVRQSSDRDIGSSNAKASLFSKRDEQSKKSEDGRGAAQDSPLPEGKLEATQPQQRLTYRLYESSSKPSRHRIVARHADQLEFFRERFEEIVAHDEDQALLIVGIRNNREPPPELIADVMPGRAYVRDDTHRWGGLKSTSFENLFAYFVEAANDASDAVFIDWIPFSERSGDIQRLIDDASSDRVDWFETRLREKGFRFVLAVAIDIPVTTSSILYERSWIRYLPWTALWLAEFARSQRFLSADALHAQVGMALQCAAEWYGHHDDNSELRLFSRLNQLEQESYGGDFGAALAAIERAIGADNAKTSEEPALIGERRVDLAQCFGSADETDAVDPIKQVMLVVAAFAGGARVSEYYSVCRELLPDGPAEIERLPPAMRQAIFRDRENAERMNRDCVALPGWNAVFEQECDVARSALSINVGEGQLIELDSQWKITDLKSEIARQYPGMIISIMQRIREKRLFLTLPTEEASVLINVVCAMRDACEEGFDDRALATALTGAEFGVHDLRTPLDVVARLYPGYHADRILALVEDIDHHEHLVRAMAMRGEHDAEMEQRLATLKSLYPEATPENARAKLEDLRQEFLEASIRRLTGHIERMHTASRVASDNSRAIVPCMLAILENLLSTETYTNLLIYMIATAATLDIPDVGGRLLSLFARAGGDELGTIILTIHRWLVQALNSPKAPHLNWLRAFDPVREGKAHDDRLRALAVYVWDTAINYDILWNTPPYDRMRHLRIANKLFGRIATIQTTKTESNAATSSDEVDAALIAKLVKSFLAQSPINWLHALGALESIFLDRFDLVEYVEYRLRDIVWVVMTGAAEVDADALDEAESDIAGDLLLSLTGSLQLGFESDFRDAASKVVEAKETPNDRFLRKWISLYALFWPAIIAHWRFANFGLTPFKAESEQDHHFRVLLDEVIAAVPQRIRAFGEGFQALGKAARDCAKKVKSMRLEASAELYNLKADRLEGLANYFLAQMRDLPIVA